MATSLGTNAVVVTRVHCIGTQRRVRITYGSESSVFELLKFYCIQVEYGVCIAVYLGNIHNGSLEPSPLEQ